MLMPRVVPEYKDLAKKRIIQAAYSIFYNKGYHASTMDDIAREVGVSKGSLYSYFKSKEDLLHSTTYALTESFNKSFEDETSLEPLEELYHNLIKFEGALHLNFEITALSSHDEQIKSILRDEYEKKLETMTDFVKKQQDKGKIRNDVEAATMARILVAVYSDLAVQLLIGMDKMRVHENLKDSLSAVLEKNVQNDQKTLNKYFSSV